MHLPGINVSERELIGAWSALLKSVCVKSLCSAQEMSPMVLMERKYAGEHSPASAAVCAVYVTHTHTPCVSLASIQYIRL